MSCVTCEVTPPDGHGGPARSGDGHVGVRLGDALGPGWLILFNGRNVTLQTIEAHTGDDDGWVELYILNGDGAPTIHPADPDRGIPPHAATVIRHGQVHVIRAGALIDTET